MSSVRSLIYDHCAKCNERCLFDVVGCRVCKTPRAAPQVEISRYAGFTIAQSTIARQRAGMASARRAGNYGGQTPPANARRIKAAAARLERRRGAGGRVEPGA